MRSVIPILLAAAMLAGCQTTEHRPGLLAEEQYLGGMIIYNGSDGPISKIGVRPTGATEWRFISGPNIASGESLGLSSGTSRICLWDFLIESMSGEREEYLGVDGCNVRRLTFPKG